MSVNAVNQRHYHDYHLESSEESQAAEGFDAVISSVVGKAESFACRGCVRAAPVAEMTASATKEAAVTENTNLKADNDGPTEAEASVNETVSDSVNGSAMYRFSMFIRISGDMNSLQSGLIDEFKMATRKFVTTLHGHKSHGIEALDGYLGKAEEAAAGGMQTSKSFIDNILAAADAGLKAVTASISGSAWMTGLNLNGSGSSGGLLTSTSPMDIARLQLQDALQKSSAYVSQAGSKVSYGSGYSLELIKNTTELRIVDPSESDKTGESAENTVTAEKSGLIATRNLVLEKFLQLVDSFSSSLAGGAKITLAGFSFACKNGLIEDYREVETGDASDSSAEEAAVAGESEEVIV